MDFNDRCEAITTRNKRCAREGKINYNEDGVFHGLVCMQHCFQKLFKGRTPKEFFFPEVTKESI